MSRSFGVPGESARRQAETRRKRREELEQLELREKNWDGGAKGEESTAEAIAGWCPNAVALHDRRLPDSRTNIDHIVLVPSGVWVIDTKRVKGRIKVEDARGGTQKLLINGNNQTALVHKLTGQVNAVKSALAVIDPQVPVYGAFCFWLPIESKRELLNPFTEDSGLPVFRTWTINGDPLFYPRQMTRRLNSAGTLSGRRAEELATALAERFPAASGNEKAAISKPSASTTKAPSAAAAAPPLPHSAPVPAPASASSPAPTRLSKEDFKAEKEAEHQRAWEEQRGMVEAALDAPVPALLGDRLSSDGAIWCHPALWHSRVYLGCVHGKVGRSFAYRQAAAVVAAHHPGRPGALQWRALTAFLEHLQTHGYVSFTNCDGRVGYVVVTADIQSPPVR